MTKKKVLITGATSGIGREAALQLAEDGHVLILAARRQEVLEEVADVCLGRGADTHTCCCDVTNEENCKRFIEVGRSVGEDLEPVLVNAAGTATFGDFSQLSMEEFRAEVAVNYLGPIYACHAAVPWMLERGGGQIINVLSIAAVHVFPGSSAYCSTKAALHMFSKVLAAEYRAGGVRVTSFIPGAVNTPLWENRDFVPDREEMLSPATVGGAIRDLVNAPADRNVDELVLMPPKGIL